MTIKIASIALSLLAGSAAALLVSNTGMAAEVRGVCHNGAAWFGFSSDGQPGTASLTPCNEEEPADIIRLSCLKRNKTIDISLDYPQPSTSQKTFNGRITVDGKSHRLKARLNDQGMYETLELSVRQNHPVIAQLTSGSTAKARFGKQKSKIHLKGSGKAMRMMLDGCGIGY